MNGVYGATIPQNLLIYFQDQDWMREEIPDESQHHGKPVCKKAQAGKVRLTKTLPSMRVWLSCN